MGIPSRTADNGGSSLDMCLLLPAGILFYSFRFLFFFIALDQIGRTVRVHTVEAGAGILRITYKHFFNHLRGIYESWMRHDAVWENDLTALLFGDNNANIDENT